VIAVVFEPLDFLRENREALLDGFRRTLQVAAVGIGGAFLIGAVLGAARAHRIPVVSQLAAVYVEVIRNTPILIQIFMLFFALPQIGVRLEAGTVAWLSVMVWGGAFNTENFRAGFEAVPKRYREAGLALGFSRLATFANVTLPIGVLGLAYGLVELLTHSDATVEYVRSTAPAIALTGTGVVLRGDL